MNENKLLKEQNRSKRTFYRLISSADIQISKVVSFVIQLLLYQVYNRLCNNKRYFN